MCKIFDNQNHEFWHSVIKPWFKPERFGITHLWFSSGFSHIGYGEYHTIKEVIGYGVLRFRSIMFSFMK